MATNSPYTPEQLAEVNERLVRLEASHRDQWAGSDTPQPKPEVEPVPEVEPEPAIDMSEVNLGQALTQRFLDRSKPEISPLHDMAKSRLFGVPRT
jgi:hypothetical protein